MTHFHQPAPERAASAIFSAALLAVSMVIMPICAQAQNQPSTADDGIGAMPYAPSAAVSYRPPSARDRFRLYLFNAYGPPAIFSAAIFAGIDQSRNAPPEWRQGAQGFAKRFGSNFGESAVEETVRYTAAAALRQDTKFYRCNCSGFFPRLWHGLSASATVRASDGRSVLSGANLAAPFAGGLAATAAWYPSRFGPRDGIRWGAVSLGIRTGIDVVREFLPSRR